MRKILSLLLTSAMFATVLFVGAPPATVHAATAGAKEKTINKLHLTKENTAKYKEGEAIIVLSDNFDNSSNKRIKSAVNNNISKDYHISKIWTFTALEENSYTKSGVRSYSTGESANSATEAEDTLKIAKVESDTLSTTLLLKQLRENDNVKIAEPNYIRKASSLPNDTYSTYQWGLQNTGQNKGTQGVDTKVSSLWDNGTTGTEKVVAIIDTGVNYTHSDLKDNIWDNPYPNQLKGDHGYDFVNGDTDPMDDNGHGSHCAGIIGAKGNNSTGITGVNQNVKIMALKFLDDEGSGSDENAIAAYNYINRAINLGVNVVAINNSWGGEGGSEVYSYLMDVVGSKGAISICAAGNESKDIDNEELDYSPATADSDYNICVGATTENGNLASFSNTGKSNVDIGAPGTDILSTVSYNCFNPTIYEGAQKSELCSSNYSDFEESSNAWGVPAEADVKINGNQAPSGTVSISSNDYFGKATSGKSLRLKVNNAKAGDFVTVSIPYTQKTSETAPYLSLMTKASGPVATETIDFFGEELPITSYINAIDLPADKGIKNSDELETTNYAVTDINGNADCWSHLYKQTDVDKNAPEQQRHIVLVLECAYSGNYDVYIDDMGMSKDNVSEDNFCKYDFYNGTSMATPFVTGAVALLSEGMTSEATVDDLVDKVNSSIKNHSGLIGKIASGGTLDFSQELYVPAIKGVTVDPIENQLHIYGTNFGLDSTVKINGTDVSSDALDISKKEIIVDNDNWINTKATISVTANGNTATKENVYRIKGKTAYTLNEDQGDVSFNGLATDGRHLFAANSSDDSIYSLDTADNDETQMSTLMEADVQDFFDSESTDTATNDFRFGKDLVYMNGYLYNIGEMCEILGSNSDDEENSAKEKTSSSEYISSDSDNDSSYFTQYRLIAMNPKTGETKDLGIIPPSFNSIGGSTLAAYNGKLLLIGGYDYASNTKALSTKVMVYDPAQKSWTNGPTLPEGRGGGKALQVGNSLVYTLGYTEGNSCPENLILTGSQWHKSDKGITPYEYSTQTFQGKDYRLYSGSIGLCEEGLLYSGLPTKELGDTFTYNVAQEKYASTEYNFIEKIGRDHFNGTVVKDKLLGFNDDNEMYSAEANNGLVKIAAPTITGGYISGTNTYFVPGSTVTLKPVAKSGYYKTSFTYNGSAVKTSTKTVTLTENTRASAVFGKYVTKISPSNKSLTLKAGKTHKLKYKISPSTATNKKVTFKSSKTRYATVSSKGVVKAKRAGKAKTVKITIKAADGSGKTATVKVKIK